MPLDHWFQISLRPEGIAYPHHNEANCGDFGLIQKIWSRCVVQVVVMLSELVQFGEAVHLKQLNIIKVRVMDLEYH